MTTHLPFSTGISAANRITRCVLPLFFGGISLALSSAASPPPDSQVLAKFDFESGTLAGWIGNPTLAAIDPTAAHSGKSCVVLNLNKNGGSPHTGIQLPAVKEPWTRLVRIKLFVKCRNVPNGNVKLSMIKQFHGNKEPQWLLHHLNSTYATLPVTTGWTEACVEGFVDADVRSLDLYLAASCPDGQGQVWFDDISVELLDRGLYLDSPRPNPIFTAERISLDYVVSAPERLFAGEIVAYDEENVQRLTIPITPKQPRINITLPTRGFYRLQARATYQDGVRFESDLPVAVVGPSIPNGERMRSPFGMSGGGDPFLAAGARWDRRHVSLDEEEFKQAAAEGFKSKRTATIWDVDPDHTSIYCLWPQPSWLQDRKNGSSPPNAFDMCRMKDRGQFKKLVEYVVRNISRRPIEYVEVANEPDGWKGPWSELVAYHKDMAEAVRKASPATKVIGPSLATIRVNDLKRLADLGLFNYLDGLSIHNYVPATGPEGDFIQNIRDLKKFLGSINKSNLPIFITEYGWTLPPPDWQKPVSPLTQARYCSRSLILLAAEQIDAIQWFCMRWADPQGPVGYGLLNWENTPRPSYAAYANTVRCLTGVTGPGRCLRLTPTTYLVLFRKPNSTLAAIWDIAGEQRVFLPPPWLAARDMMGRPISPAKDGIFMAGPSPFFVELPGKRWYDLKQAGSMDVTPEEKIDLPWVPLWVSSAATVSGTRLHLKDTAATGPYMAIGESKGRLQYVNIRLNKLLEHDTPEIVWPISAPFPSVQLTVTSGLNIPIKVKGTVAFEATPQAASQEIRIAPKKSALLNLPLANIKPAKRYRGKVVMKVIGGAVPIECQVPLDLTLIPCLPLSQRNWNLIPAMDITSWASPPPPMDITANQPSLDGPTLLRLGYNQDGLMLRLTVSDRSHRQTQNPGEMWTEDSIQVAFDLDREQPWQPNIGGYNGHFRVFEYGIALGADGPMVWRWVSYFKELPDNSRENRVKAQVKREGNQTIYDVCFPWAVLGTDKAPPGGSKIGFALVVNDQDDTPGRHVRSLFNGIVDEKDPTQYGSLWIR